jgi:hypothetical protein
MGVKILLVIPIKNFPNKILPKVEDENKSFCNFSCP